MESDGFEAFIGLEIHAQLLTRTKLFCGCPVRFGDAPNTHICPVCLGLPGALPALNREAVELALRLALALDCRISERSRFARKNYFYADLPKGYQITQYDQPLAVGGHLDLAVAGVEKTVRIVRAHLEEDAGRLVHEGLDPPASGVDFNRSGIPLVEVVTEPELRSGAEAAAFAQALRLILQYTGVSAAQMEQGHLRCDANVSVRPKGCDRLGTKVEVKNLNSFRFLARALDFEIERQTSRLSKGVRVDAETRWFNPSTRRTATLRQKEGSAEYRYFAEPDLPPLSVGRQWIERVRAGLPELPAARMRRLIRRYGIPPGVALRLCSARVLVDFFEETAALAPDPQLAAQWVVSELARLLQEKGRPREEIGVNPDSLAELLRLTHSGKLDRRAARQLLREMIATGETASSLVKRQSLTPITPRSSLEPMVLRTLQEHPRQVEQYRKGRKNVLNWLVGQVRAASAGKADPQTVRELLEQILDQAP